MNRKLDKSLGRAHISEGPCGPNLISFTITRSLGVTVVKMLTSFHLRTPLLEICSIESLRGSVVEFCQEQNKGVPG